MRIFLCVFVFWFSHQFCAQDEKGYFGKKAFIQSQVNFSAPLSFNLLTNYSNTGYKKSGTSLTKSKGDIVRHGFHLTLGYAYRKNVAFSFEIGQDYFHVLPPNKIYDEGSSGFVSVFHERLSGRSMTFLPKLEIGNKDALLPMGLTHQIGLGLTTFTILEKNYLFALHENNAANTTSYSDNKNEIIPIDFSKIQPGKLIFLFYGLNMRTPINKSLFINYGINYAIPLKTFLNYPKYSNYTETALDILKKQNTLSFIKANIGITYAF